MKSDNSGGSSSGEMSKSKPKFASVVRLRAAQERVANVHGRPTVYLKNARHGRHVIPFGLAERGVTNPFNTESQHEWGSWEWLKEKRNILNQFIKRVSVLGGEIEILMVGVKGAFEAYNSGRTSKKSLDRFQGDLDQLARVKVLVKRVLQEKAKPNAEPIDFEAEFRHIAGLVGLGSDAIVSDQKQQKSTFSFGSFTDLSQEEQSFFDHSKEFSEKLGRDGGYSANTAHIQALCEALTEGLLKYFNSGLPGITFHKHKPNISFVKSTGKTRLTKSKTPYRYEQQAAAVGASAGGSAHYHRPDAGEQIPLGRLDARYCDPNFSDLELEAIRAEIRAISEKLKHVRDSTDSGKQEEEEQLEASLDALKARRAAKIDSDLLRDMYLLFDYPRLVEEDDPKLVDAPRPVKQLYQGKEQDFIEEHWKEGYRTNDLGHLSLSIARFVYFFFNAYPQAAIDFDWDVTRPLADGREVESRIIAPFVRGVAHDWSLDAGEILSLIDDVKTHFFGFATDPPNPGVEKEFDDAASSDASSHHASDSDGDSGEKQVAVTSVAANSMFSKKAVQSGGHGSDGPSPGAGAQSGSGDDD